MGCWMGCGRQACQRQEERQAYWRQTMGWKTNDESDRRGSLPISIRACGCVPSRFRRLDEWACGALSSPLRL